MQQTLNLDSFVEAFLNLSSEEFINYKAFMNIKIDENEMTCLTNLYNQIKISNNLNSFYFGYQIHQIGKEFDLLRISENSILNIEIKKESSHEKILAQLNKNKYYLELSPKDLILISYISDQNTFYELVNDELQEIDSSQVIEYLNKQSAFENVNLDTLFHPTHYLVSPFNSPEKFLNGRYFLTNDQIRIKKEILASITNSEQQFFAVSGEPGTGKTLLIYDLAKTLQKHNKVGIIHCAQLNNGQQTLIQSGFKIFSALNSEMIIKDSTFEIIIVDEAQRFYTNQLNYLVTYAKQKNIKILFCYDGKQCFSNAEFRRKNTEFIEIKLEAKLYRLTNTIRSNKEIKYFVDNLFLPRLARPGSPYKNIKINYFDNPRSVNKYIRHLLEHGWQPINYTSSRYNIVSYDSYQQTPSPNAHIVIGQEFEKVVAVIDQSIYINSENYLASRKVPGAPNYDMDKMLYQILTRAKEQLNIIILNNPSVLKRCLNILKNY